MARLRWFVLVMFVLVVFTHPVLAQDAAEPAALVPATVSAYVEIRVDANLESDLQDLARLGALLANESPEDAAAEISFDEMLQEALPGTTFEDDILPWVGGHIGVAFVGDMAQPDQDFAAVAPVTDSEAASAFVARLSSEFPDVETEGDMTIYRNDDYQLVSAPQFVAVGTPVALDAVLDMDAALADDAVFNATRAALPPDPLASVYISGRWIREASGETIPDSGMGFPGPTELFETALRLHPAESAMEDALLQRPALNSAAGAIYLADDRLDIRGVVSLDAEYPAPTLATSSAGAGLIAYIPQDAYTVFASYDSLGTLGIGAGSIGFLAFMGPVIGSVFDEIIASFDATPGPTPTPLPTPTPVPTPSADDLLDQVQPFVEQAEAFLGMELNELYGLMSGEYALAMFPVDNPDTQNFGAALWIQTSDPAGLSRVFDNAMAAAIKQMSIGGSVAAERSQETINGLDMTVWSVPGQGESLVYGALADDVFVITVRSSFQAVANASRGDGVLVQSRHWPGDLAGAEYSSDLEAVTYVDIGGLMKLNPSSQESPFESLLAGLDLQADGLIVGRMTVTRAP